MDLVVDIIINILIKMGLVRMIMMMIHLLVETIMFVGKKCADKKRELTLFLFF